MNNLLRFALVLVTATACKGKDKEPTEAPKAVEPAPPTAAGSPTTPPAAPPAAPAAPAADAAKLAASTEPAFGCFAWSATAKAAACITGTRSISEPAELALQYVGGTAAAVKLGAAIDDAAATAASTTLAKEGFTPVTGAATPLADGTAVDLGKGASLTWTRKQTAAGGDNVAPTHANTVIARCGGADVPVFKDEREGDDPTFTVRTVGDHAIVELKMHVAREGESSDDFSAAVLDLTTCKVAASS